MEYNLEFFMNRISDSTLRAIAYELLEEGYKVLFSMWNNPNEAGNYFSYEKYGRIGYVSINRFGELSCSSQYKPSRDHGTGHQYKKDCSLSIEDIMKAKDFGFVKGVKPWGSLEEFISYKEKFCKMYIFSKD